jgi:predicted ATP-dependent endonuclease of OLD family
LGEKEKKETAILEQKIKEITQKNKLTDEEFKCIGKYYNEIEQFRSRIYKKRNLLYIILNELFETNNKSIEYNGHTAFIVKDGNRNLKIYDLSAGEKQILLILLKVSVFHSQPMVLLLDTPELALHALWQANLVDMINKLNPNCQIIIATHSPNVFGKRWRNKVVNMKDITTLLVS